MIAQETIDEVLNRASLIEIVGEVVQLKRAGRGYSGLCPFHSERSPSFHVHDEDGYFHCFGCGESGNIFKFVMETRGLSFPEAVEDLATRYGIPIKYQGATKSKVAEPKDIYFKMNHLAWGYFIDQLKRSAPNVISYIQERGITTDSLQRFGIGFAPTVRTGLLDYLRKQKFNDEDLIRGGLVRRNEKGETYDTFRGRLIFPIFQDPKKIAGFGGRVIPSLFDEAMRTKLPKYLNSPESPVYQKSKVLYGLPQAIQSIRDSGTVYIVEGYMDVVGLSQAGVTNVVAACGTALGEGHVKRLSQIAKRVIVLFDGDDAGRMAAGRTFELFLNSGVDVAALFLPEEDDPDTISLKEGANTPKYLEKLPRKPLVDCYIEAALSRYGVKAVSDLGGALKGTLASEVVKILKRVENSVERSDYLERAGRVLRIEPRRLEEMLKGEATPQARVVSDSPPDEDAPESNKQPGTIEVRSLDRVEQELLLAAMAKKDSIPSQILRDGDLCAVAHPVTLHFIESLSRISADASTSEDSKREQIKQLLKDMGPSWIDHWKRAYEMGEDKSVDFEDSLREIKKSVKRLSLLNRISELDRQITQAESEDEKLVLLQEKILVNRQVETLGRVAAVPKAAP